MLARIALWLSSLSLLGFGVAFLIAPLATMNSAGIALSGGIAATELRAFYGGLEVALGLLLALTAVRPEHQRAGLVLSFAVFAGIGGARFLGLVIDATPTPFLLFAVTTEVTLAALSAIALQRLQR